MNILFIDTISSLLKTELEKLNHTCDTAYEQDKLAIEKIISNYEGIIIRSRFVIDRRFIDKAKNLKFIARAGSGLENIDIKYANQRNIYCFNASGGNSQAVAEHALGMLLSLINNLNKANQEIQRGKWIREENRGLELSGKTIGIIGVGNTGSAFARLLEGFNVKILAYDKYIERYSDINIMKSIYAEADILSLHIPLNYETKYLVNNDFIKQFRKSFYLINTSRGKCVCIKSIVHALKKKKIKGVCLDVLEYEKESFEQLALNGFPEEMMYLTKSSNTILSPHIAGWTKESKTRIAKILLEKIITYSDQ